MADLEVRNVEVSYKKQVGIKEASLQANAGEIIGFIGADGAGKSSLMHAVAGVLRFEGEISYFEQVYHSPKEAEKIKPYTGLMPQGIGLVLYETLTVGEHLSFFANIRNLRQDASFKTYRQKLLHMAGLSDFTNRQAGKLSGGMMQKLSLICTLLHRPKLLILDEPTTGVDPLSRLELWEILDNIRKEEGTIVLVSTAYMQEAAKMDRVLLFDEGEIIARGTVPELIDSVREYTFEGGACPEKENAESDCFTFDKRSYSLDVLSSSHAEPTLEALFFVNALRKKRTLPKIEIDAREGETKIPETVMEAKGLTKRFGDFTANDHIDMRLKGGEIVGLLGANGAGKTTFMKMLLGLYPIDEGELTLLGRSIQSSDDRQALKAKIGYVSQHFALYKDMTVRENLIYFANMHRIPVATAIKRINRYARELGFDAYMEHLPGELPLGINQRFSVAAALLHEPVILFLDEPTSGVDTIARAQFWEMLHRLKTSWGISILITTHYMSEAEYCDRVVLMRQGRKIADDTVKALYAKHPEARNFEDIFLSYYRSES
ncbi:ATP-binding cassette domain-containing protein [Sulfurovum sp. NBC37-1]|uniref:ATP-binding cassette domain-containing protein n=1 Tax=Sulfurovum sp. (strain NBC37-1) TaxID=387093 RepID=UPI0001587619|nr:ATP-binding cassette domain-containing protein [Sulfurovum sp. NBC37-1]BAF71239.1 multidrug ABC transporter [Sulfurovum sp. NBC37-1]